MATPAKKGAAPAAVPANVAGMDPDSFVQGGLADDFDGVVTEARFCPWDYNGNIDHPVLGVRLVIKRTGETEGEADVVQHYSVGDLSKWVPTMDGENPAVDSDSYYVASEDDPDQLVINPEADGIYALKVGGQTGLGAGSNWAQFVGALLDAGFDRARLSGDIRFMEGVGGHWNRVPQIKRSGIVSADDKKRDLLVITALSEGEAPASTPTKTAATNVKAAGAGKSTAAAAKSSASKSTPAAAKPAAASSAPAAGSGSSSLDDVLTGMVVDFLRGGGVKKSGLAGYVVKNAPDAVTKSKGVKRVTEAEFLNRFENDDETTPRWYYDAEGGELTLIDAEE